MAAYAVDRFGKIAVEQGKSNWRGPLRPARADVVSAAARKQSVNIAELAASCASGRANCFGENSSNAQPASSGVRCAP
jgi:hypothetical protein